MDTKTFEILPTVSKSDLSLKYGYADESGINMAEGALHYKIVAGLSAIRYTDSVGVARISSPKGCVKNKNIFNYEYFPRCEAECGVIAVDASKKDTIDYKL